MPEAPSSSEPFLRRFYRWWLRTDPAASPRWTILAHPLDRPALTALRRELNLHHDGATRWLEFDTGHLAQIAADAVACGLLGLCVHDSTGMAGRDGHRELLRALARRGNAILSDPHAAKALRDLENLLSLKVTRSGLSLNGTPTSAVGPGLLAALASDWIDAAARESAQPPASDAQPPRPIPLNFPAPAPRRP